MYREGGERKPDGGEWKMGKALDQLWKWCGEGKGLWRPWRQEKIQRLRFKPEQALNQLHGWGETKSICWDWEQSPGKQGLREVLVWKNFSEGTEKWGKTGQFGYMMGRPKYDRDVRSTLPPLSLSKGKRVREVREHKMPSNKAKNQQVCYLWWRCSCKAMKSQKHWVIRDLKKKKKAPRADSIGSRRREAGDPRERTASMYREKGFGLLWVTPSTSHLGAEPGKHVPSNQT